MIWRSVINLINIDGKNLILIKWKNIIIILIVLGKYVILLYKFNVSLDSGCREAAGISSCCFFFCDIIYDIMVRLKVVLFDVFWAIPHYS